MIEAIEDHPLQLQLFPGLRLSPTPADRKRGLFMVTQCAHCGLLVAAPDCGDYKHDSPRRADERRGDVICSDCGRVLDVNGRCPAGCLDHLDIDPTPPRPTSRDRFGGRNR